MQPPINQKTLKEQFETIQKLDTKTAKKQHYTKSYYYKNKARYQKYYQDNKEAIKEYVKNYKQKKVKTIAKKTGMTIRHGTFVVSFDVGPTQSRSSTSGLGTQSSLLQLFFQQPVPSVHEAAEVSSVLSLSQGQPQQAREQAREQVQEQEEQEVQEQVHFSISEVHSL
jgi:hypothetical protein